MGTSVCTACMYSLTLTRCAVSASLLRMVCMGQSLSAHVSVLRAQVWNLTNCKLRASLVGHTGYINTVTVSPDGSLCASGGKARIPRSCSNVFHNIQCAGLLVWRCCGFCRRLKQVTAFRVQMRSCCVKWASMRHDWMHHLITAWRLCSRLAEGE